MSRTLLTASAVTSSPPPKPTKADLLDAANRKVPDIIGPNLRVLFVGINPGLYTAAIGYHFARPGNRFWPALFAGGFTERLLQPWENCELIESGYGITNMVARPTARADELSKAELLDGAKLLASKVKKYRPRFVAVVGISSYRTAFDRPLAVMGRQNETLERAQLWVLPNPSGLNAHYQPKRLGEMFRELFEASKAVGFTSDSPRDDGKPICS